MLEVGVFFFLNNFMIKGYVFDDEREENWRVVMKILISGKDQKIQYCLQNISIWWLRSWIFWCIVVLMGIKYVWLS